MVCGCLSICGNESQKADIAEFTAEIKKPAKPEDVRHWAAALVWVQLLQVLLTLVWALLNTGVVSVLIGGVVSVAFTFLCGFWVFWAAKNTEKMDLALVAVLFILFGALDILSLFTGTNASVAWTGSFFLLIVGAFLAAAVKIIVGVFAFKAIGGVAGLKEEAHVAQVAAEHEIPAARAVVAEFVGTAMFQYVGGMCSAVGGVNGALGNGVALMVCVYGPLTQCEYGRAPRKSARYYTACSFIDTAIQGDSKRCR